LAPHAAVTIRNYYKSFGSISGALAGAFGLGSLLSLIPFDGSQYVFPPLGDAAVVAHFGLVSLAISTTYLAFYFPLARLKWITLVLVVAAALGFCFYLVNYMKFVRRIDVPSQSSTIQVSVGDERTAFAISNFGNETDWNILRDRGLDDEQISRLWTPQSLRRARLLLFASFSVSILPLVFAFSLGVRAQMP
jgi:hypothetical protein